MGEKTCGINSQSRVNFLWDSFVNAENKSYEKGIWLDVFLAEFLAQIKAGENVKDIIRFSDSSAVSTLIACELLSDVHEICSRPGAGGDHDDLALLRRHLLFGRGWRCLAAIQCLGTQDISCAKELASLLISLYSIDNNEHIEAPETSSNPYITLKKNVLQQDGEDDISVRLQVPLRKKSRTMQHCSPSDNSPPLRYRKTSNASVNRRSMNLDQETTNNFSSESEMVEDNCNNNNNNCNGNNSNSSNSPLRSVKNIKIRLNPMDFDYFTSVVRSETEQRLDSESYVPGESKRQKIRKILPEDFYDERINNVFKAKLNAIDLKFIITELLKSLTMSENFSTVSPNLSDKSVAIQSLVFALDTLCRQHTIDSDNYNIITQLKYNLIRLLLCSLEKILKLPDVTSVIVQKGVIPIMKRLLEDVLQTYNINSNDMGFSGCVISEDIEFIYSLLYGGITILHCLLLQNNLPDKLNQFLIIFHQFNSGKLIDRSLLLLLTISKRISPTNNELLLKRCKKIINSIGQLISALKKTRSKIIHIRRCKRNRHKHCTPLNVMYHHDSLFGSVYTNSVLSTELNKNCSVSTLFMILTKFLTDSVNKDIVLFTMHIMMTCGTCCCFPSSQFITKLISVIKQSDYKMRSIALILLERTYYRQMGALYENSSCDTCFKKKSFLNSNDNNPSSSQLSSVSLLPEKNFSSCDTSSQIDDSSLQIQNEKQSILLVFRELLLSSDCNVSYSVGSHLLRVIPKCNLIIQREILFTVFYPAFLISKKQFLSNHEKNDNSKYVLTTCLSAFTNLLSRVRFTEEFLKLNALKHIEELLFEPDLIKLCCSIIEIAVIVQVWKWEHCDKNSNSSDYNRLGIDDLEMFLGHVKSATIKLLKSVSEHNENSFSSSTSSSFVSISNPNDIIEGIEVSESFINNSQITQSPVPDENLSDFSTLDHAKFSDIDKWDTFSQLLENCSVLWRTCANIILYSPQIRKYFSKHVISKYCYDLLFKTLDGIAKHTSISGATMSRNVTLYSDVRKKNSRCSTSTMNESFNEKFYNANQVTLKLFESLLILNLISPAVDEKTGNLMTEDTLLSVLHNTLIKTMDSGHVNARHLCDVLLRACSIAPSHHLVLPTHKMPKVGYLDSATWDNGSDMSPPTSFYYNFIDADIDCTVDSSEVISQAFDDILPDMTGDEGYDADIEVPEPYMLDEKSSDESSADGNDIGVRSLTSSRKVSALGPVDFKRDLIIVHPGLCTITIHLLVHYLQMCEIVSDNHSVGVNSTSIDDLSSRISDTVYCLQRLAALCQEATVNCQLLIEQNISYQLLTLFKPFLVTAKPSYTGLQHAILNVVTRLAEISFEAKDLCELLSLFTEDNPPLESLLSALVNIVSSIKVQPSFMMYFPTSIVIFPSAKKTNIHDPAEKLGLSMRERHSAAGIDSCWSRSSVILGINQELGWSMWASGFSLSMWLCIDKSYHLSTAMNSGYHNDSVVNGMNVQAPTDSVWDKQDDGSTVNGHGSGYSDRSNENKSFQATSSGILHIVSIGYDLLTIEFWIDNMTNTIIVKLVRSDGGVVQEVLSESTINNQLSVGLWHHMAINIRDSFQKRKICIEVTVVIDGWSESCITLTYSGLLVRKSQPYCIAVGHHSTSCNCQDHCHCNGRWFFGSLMMFRAAVFTKETAAALSALGPDYTHLTETEVGNTRPNFSRLFSSRALSSGIMWEKLLNDPLSLTKQLQENLLLVYSAQTPNVVKIYPQISSNSASGIVGSLLNSQSLSRYRVVAVDKRPSQQLPMCINPAIISAPYVLHTHTFVTAANTVGGLSVFLFLFARVVEMEPNEEIQARALYLLLRIVQNSTEFNSEFVAQQQHKLLTHVMSSDKCRPGHHMLKAILDASCDRPGLLIYHAGTSQFQTCSKSGAVLVNPALITGPILSTWHDWEKHASPTSHKCLNTLLQALLILLREDHPQHEFNAAQLNRVNTVNVLLQMCKERFLTDDASYPLFDVDTCRLLVELVAGLMSSPPQNEQIIAIVNFLILSHPAHATYVTHLKSSFYFLIPTAGTVSHHFSLSQKWKTSLPKTDDVINNARINILANSLAYKGNKMKRNVRSLVEGNSEIDSSESNLNFAVDPVKLNKALTDLQIKQNEEEKQLKIEKQEVCNNYSNSKNSLEINQHDRTDDRHISSKDSTHSSATSDSKNDVHDGNGCDSGIAGSFKDHVVINLQQERTHGHYNDDDDDDDDDNYFRRNNAMDLINEMSNSSSVNEVQELPSNIHNLGKTRRKSSNNQNSGDGIHNDYENEHKKKINCYTNDNVDIVIERLLLLLRDFILVLPDSKAEYVLTNILKVEVLIVLVNHPSSCVRVAVIKVLSLYLERATEEELARFLRMKGFHLVANQLYSQPATHELVGSVAALITGQHWLHIDDQLPSSPSQVSSASSSVSAQQPVVILSPLQLSAIPAFLALVQKTVNNPPLAHATILFLGRLFNKATQAYRPLMELGIIEVLIKTLLELSHQQPVETSSTIADQSAEDNNECDEMWQRLLITDIQNLLITILSRAIHNSGGYHMKVVLDIFLLLSYMERIEQRCCGSKSKCVFMLRTCHCILLATALDIIHNMIHQSQQSLPSRIRSTATAFLTSVFSHNYEQCGTIDEIVKNNYPSDTNCTTSSSNSLHDRSTTPSSFSSLLPLHFTHGELGDRFELITTKAVEMIVNNVPIDGCYSQLNVYELNFIDDLLSTLLLSITCIVERRSSARTSWMSIMWSSRETIKSLSGKLLIWLLSPGQLNKIRMSAVNKIRNEHKCKEIILFIFENNHQLSEQLLLYLWDLMNGSLCGSLSPSELKDCQELNYRLHNWGLILQERPSICYEEDVSLLWDRTLIEQKAWWKQQDRFALRIISRTESTIKSVTESALSVTKIVMDHQNSERKLVIEMLKNDLSEHVHTQILWKNVVRQLTHERAVWYFPKSYPRSWQLDPTEGPNRIRNRLQRCHLNISKKYLKSEFQDKIDAANMNRPLSYLFDKEGVGQVSSMSALLIEKLHSDMKIRHMVTAHVVTPSQSVPGELLIGETCLYFVPSSDNSLKELNSGTTDVSFSSQAWEFDEIKEVHTRRFQLKERALEIFLLNGKTYLLAFETSVDRDKFQSELCQCDLPNRVAGDHLSDAVQLWREGHLTNWEYLTILNKMAGRSYNDLMQYPVMPFILADYSSRILDLTESSSYRNLEKPMAVQDKKNEQHYINNYNYLKQEMEICGSSQSSYHYGSHYSNSGVVLHFLVRLPPFTGMFLTYQDDNFDLPDRTFHSIDTTWRLTSRESTTDVKELIPEFFFLPEFLINMEGFDFGVRQNGQRVDDVTLPPWAENDPRKFTLILRQALESDFVRENIPHWIDLVFGYKQTGKAAVDAVNVFHPATYCGFDVEAIEDPLERCAWETMVRTYGQTPRQLFRTPHPMCVQSLISNRSLTSTHCSVKGIQWGNYAGSPDEPNASVIYKHQHRLPVMKLIPLLTNDVFGLAPSSCLLLTYSKSKSLSLIMSAANSSSTTSGGSGLCIHGAAIIFWGHSDGVLRVKMKRDLPPYPVARPPCSSWDVITQCTSAPDTNQLWIGYSSGRILVYKYKFTSGQNTVEFSNEPYTLVGHTAPILSISLSHGFNVAVTGCQDGIVILWDMNCLSYIRSLPTISMPVSLTCISETTGDIVTVGHDSDSGTSTLRLHSINVMLLGSITTCQRITAICFSTAPEGISVNVIATGMEDGSIKFWSTWDLSPVGTDLVTPITDTPQPIICLIYSYDSHHLYASTPSGHVVIWESRTANSTGKQPKFLNLSNLST
ncbi:lysosomal-trafficking regulator mauve isoform X2 [Lycorma delicatula]|uniref:lysosomal-trafficking regulator mauve isoform X2 n=1 Tax=Lycorma delicatula TaxID=130591 RepID=UPI003F50F973